MTFTTNKLSGHRTLVTGRDNFGNEGKAVLDSTEWDAIQRSIEIHDAQKDFDEKVLDFYAPINEAADELAGLKVATETADPTFFIELEPGEEGTPGKASLNITLNHDSAVLRILEKSGVGTDRLIWVGDTLEILAA
jgi:hypothetical protein